jgi:hypothetical protein
LLDYIVNSGLTSSVISIEVAGSETITFYYTVAIALEGVVASLFSFDTLSPSEEKKSA